MSTTPAYIQAFADGGPAALETLGGKGASLVTMTDAGMPCLLYTSPSPRDS